MSQSENKLIRSIRDNWIFIVFIAGLIIAYANNQAAVAKNTSDIALHDKKIELIQETYAKISSQISSVETNLEWLKKNQK